MRFHTTYARLPTDRRLHGGYTLLFAVLTAALVMGVAVFILDVARKQFLLSSTARDSMSAFYAAESGIECSSMASNNNNLTTSTTTPQSINCGGSLFNFNYAIGSADPSYGFYLGSTVYTNGNSKIYVPFGTNGPCAILSVYTGKYDAAGDNQVVVDSRGYNQCDDANQQPSSAPNTLERGLRFVIQ